MTITTYLRFPDEASAKATLAPYVDADGNWIVASHTHALDPVGTIYTPGTYDEAGELVTEPSPLPGWHVNLIGAAPSAAAAYIVTPSTPARVFAA